MVRSRRGFSRAVALLSGAMFLATANSALAQGLFGCCRCPVICGPCDSGGVLGSSSDYGDSTGATAGAGDQFAGTPLDLGEGGPAQLGSTFAAVDSAYIDDARIRTIARFRFSISSITPLPSAKTRIQTLSPMAAISPVAFPCFSLPRNWQTIKP